ncbi:DUF1365 domain-containing protein [Hydrogenophaga sp. 5NK40-0174]|uniref:DUF1365 domain-containing protein n=1 Tax=Hydrogenophaga sp. 5NK40-0174 TaxID=3127649 RepID=UPI003103BEAA
MKAQAHIGFGQVRHTRSRPKRHAFAYPTFFLYLPLRALRAKADPALARNQRAAFSFHDTDHGDGRKDCLAWIDQLLAGHGIQDAQGEVWLQTFPRILGYVFKPVSFWYCHRTDGSLRAVVAEVNNTFGERHFYLLDQPRDGQPCRADKAFHVSPFCPVTGQYEFNFMRARDRVVMRIDYHDLSASPALLQTSVSGQLQPLSVATKRHALWRYPAMTLGVIARIHWHALQLWLKKTPFFRQPGAPAEPVTRARPDPATTTSVPQSQPSARA